MRDSKAGRALRVKVLVALACAAAVSGLSVSSALANDFAAPYNVFNNCPVHDADMLAAETVGICLASSTEGGQMKIGNQTNELGPQLVSMGAWSSEPGGSNFETVGGTPTVDAEPARIPGGLGVVPEDLRATIDSVPAAGPAVNSLHDVYAVVESAGTPTYNLLPGPTLPIKIKLVNPLLGDNCYIGSDADPIVLNLVAEFTPETVIEELPAIAGFPAVLGFRITELDVSETTFAVPAARGCGPLGLLDGLVNDRVGLPSPSGNNALHTHGDTNLIGAFTDQDAGQILSDALHSTE